MQTRTRHVMLAAAVLATGAATWAAAPTPPAAGSATAPAATATAPATGRGRGARGGGGAGGGGGRGAAAVRVEPLPDAVTVELTPPLDKNGNYKHAPKTTWGAVQGIQVKAETPRGTVTAFSAPATLAAAAAPAPAPAAAPAAAPGDAAGGAPGAGGRGGRGAGRGGGNRSCWVYIPAGYKEGDVLPFMVDHDGSPTAVVQTQLIAAMDTLIAEKKIPMMAAVFIAPVSRSVEYDTVSGVYADYIEKIVLPLAEKTGNVKLTQDPNARGSIGQSSGSAAAMGMAWFGTPAYNRVISYSGSFTSLQRNATYPNGAQAYQETLIPNSEKRPLRIWMQVGSNDLTNNGDWRIQNNAFANALKAKGYDYQFLWSEGAGHVEGGVERQTMLEAMEWVWQGYKAK